VVIHQLGATVRASTASDADFTVAVEDGTRTFRCLLERVR
jgi:hypothetical protein